MSNNNSPGEGDITSLRQISTHRLPSKVGVFVLFCCFIHWPSENKEADLAERWVRRDLSYLASYYYTVRSDDVKVLKSR